MITVGRSENPSEIYSFLEQKRLKEVFDSLTQLLSEPTNWQLNEKKNELELTYKTMLAYLTDGIKDPERDKVYHDLLRSCYKLIDSIHLELNTKNTSGIYTENKGKYLDFSVQRLNELIQSLDEAIEKKALTRLLDEGEDKGYRLFDLEKKIETIGVQFFYTIWLSEQWHTGEKELIIRILNNNIYPFTIRSLIISAMMMGLQVLFDEQKVIALLDACENKNEEIRQRALISLLLFLRKNNNRLYLYPQLNNRLQYLVENRQFVSGIRNIILQFILSQDTERIAQKIKEEILPEMIKISPILSEKIKLEDLMGETGTDEKNPEWSRVLEESGLADKLQEFSELQQEGADIMHSSFAHLKAYPFFNEISNWFLPFSSENTLIGQTNNQLALLKMLESSPVLCNSDKYSFYLSIMQMPEAYGQMMIHQFSAESDAFEKMQKEELADYSKKGNNTAKQYIQDLYRYYKVHPRRKTVDDIFEEKPDFYFVPCICQLLPDREDKMIIAEYYFNHNYFEEALVIFDNLLEEGGNDHVLYQKKGYCLQMIGDFEKALDAYLKAELLNSENSWTIRKIAHCYRILKDNKNALLYYRKIESLNPDNLSIQLSIGHCYLELKNYTEALKCYFKVEYLDNQGKRSWRPIAWCSFLTGKYEQALRYFKKITTDNPDASDYLNTGHTLLAMGNMKEAIRNYLLSIRCKDNSEEKFRISFFKDIPELVQSGISEKDIPFILDRLMYSMDRANASKFNKF